MNIPALRLLNQQLLNPQFRTPKELVSWMGAVQAQDYTMAKWAVGMRLKKAALQSIEKALHEGEIFRIHVMRPTWHLIAAEDVRWMLKLSLRVSGKLMIHMQKGMDWKSRSLFMQKVTIC